MLVGGTSSKLRRERTKRFEIGKQKSQFLSMALIYIYKRVTISPPISFKQPILVITPLNAAIRHKEAGKND